MRSIVIVVALATAALAQDKPKDASKNAKDQPAAEKSDKPVTAETAKSALDFKMPDIDGKVVPLEKFKGRVVMIVNVASQCGLTPQYEQLQKLHEDYAEKGLTILAFPANDFMGQEPGTNQEIEEFCKTNFGVKFPLFSKVAVKGKESCELYKYLTGKESNPKFGGPIRWNFTKFLTDGEGAIIARFEPRTRPDDATVIKAIEEAIAKLPKKTDEKKPE